MSENHSPAPITYKSSGNAAIEEILRLRHPRMQFAEGLYAISQAFKAETPPLEPLPAVQKDRDNLLGLGHAELAEVLAQERATFERRQFYNYAISPSELAHWARLDAWTREEAVALLLGRDPANVNWEKIKSRLLQSAFVKLYQRVLQMVERATALQTGERLDPVAVLTWGQEAGLKPPSQLVEQVEQRTGKSTRKPELLPPSDQESGRRGATEKYWTAERIEELREFHGKHKTKAAAEKFGISAQRVRELLKQSTATSTPTASSVFDLGRRK
jgi:hypothetical protein